VTIDTQPLSLTSTTVNGRRMAYHDSGRGEICVLLHGNPTSSYLWRNIAPLLTTQARCLVPDLIGMGESEKLPGDNPDRYSFFTHLDFIDQLLQQLVPQGRVTLVLHDWGSALGFEWARRNPERVAGIAYMEAIVMSLSWEQWPEQSRPVFEGLRSQAGEKMILEKNLFIERILPASVMRELSDVEMNAYRAPFTDAGNDRQPMLSWPRAIPLGGEPADVVAVVDEYARWMADNDLPKLFINAEPGAILVGEQREFCRGWRNQTEVTVPGIHFIQEDSPQQIGRAVADWQATLS